MGEQVDGYRGGRECADEWDLHRGQMNWEIKCI